MSQPEHRHRGIKERHLREAYRNIFKPEHFSSAALARHVVAFSKLRGSAMTRMQAKAMHRYHHDKIYDLSDESRQTSDNEVLQVYYHFFDDVFFFGSLKDHCVFHLREEKASELGESAMKKETKTRRLERRGKISCVEVEKRCDIFLYPPQMMGSRRSERLLVYLGSLLHGMAHTFLILWACHNKICVGRNDENKCKFCFLTVYPTIQADMGARDYPPFEYNPPISNLLLIRLKRPY